jgi:hypothetical protein
MKLRTVLFVIVLFAMTCAAAAQEAAAPAKSAQHHQYKLIDLGTLGGPSSFIPNPLTGAELTNASKVVGESDTLIPDPYTPNCLQSTCLVNHTFSSQKGILIDLGALPGVNSSIPFATNSRGQTVGNSENGFIDPLTGFPEQRAVLGKQAK